MKLMENFLFIYLLFFLFKDAHRSDNVPTTHLETSLSKFSSDLFFSFSAAKSHDKFQNGFTLSSKNNFLNFLFSKNMFNFGKKFKSRCKYFSFFPRLLSDKSFYCTKVNRKNVWNDSTLSSMSLSLSNEKSPITDSQAPKEDVFDILAKFMNVLPNDWKYEVSLKRKIYLYEVEDDYRTRRYLGRKIFSYFLAKRLKFLHPGIRAELIEIISSHILKKEYFSRMRKILITDEDFQSYKNSLLEEIRKQKQIEFGKQNVEEELCKDAYLLQDQVVTCDIMFNYIALNPLKLKEFIKQILFYFRNENGVYDDSKNKCDIIIKVLPFMKLKTRGGKAFMKKYIMELKKTTPSLLPKEMLEPKNYTLKPTENDLYMFLVKWLNENATHTLSNRIIKELHNVIFGNKNMFNSTTINLLTPKYLSYNEWEFTDIPPNHLNRLLGERQRLLVKISKRLEEDKKLELLEDLLKNCGFNSTKALLHSVNRVESDELKQLKISDFCFTEYGNYL